MTNLQRAWTSAEVQTKAAFWRAAAGATGFAVHHPRLMRALPVGLLAMAAFAVGRAAGQFITSP
jgi:hypothetical protein